MASAGKWFLEKVGGLIQGTTSPDVATADWFASQYRVMLALGIALAILLVSVALAHMLINVNEWMIATGALGGNAANDVENFMHEKSMSKRFTTDTDKAVHDRHRQGPGLPRHRCPRPGRPRSRVLNDMPSTAIRMILSQPADLSPLACRTVMLPDCCRCRHVGWGRRLQRSRLPWSALTRPPVIRGFALCLPLPNMGSVGLL